MVWRSGTAGILAVLIGLAITLPGTASGQVIIDYYYPEIPFYAGALDFTDLGLRYGVDVVDVAYLFPMYFYRPVDDLTPRPGAAALGMGGAQVSLAEGALALGWNPAGLGLLREISIVADGMLASSSSKTEDLPDTVYVEGQPDFQIRDYDVSLAGTRPFGFLGVAMPVVWIAGRPLTGGMAYRRHTNVSYGEATVLEMGLFEASGFPFVLGVDNDERGSIESFTAGLAYQAIDLSNLWVSLGATANFLSGRMQSDVATRINVRGFQDGHLSYRSRYKGFSAELGLMAGIAEKIRLGGWVGLPHHVQVYDSEFTSTPIVSPQVEYIFRLRGEVADYDMEIPLFVTGGISVGPIKGIEIAADINYRPWSEAEIVHRNEAYSIFDTNYPGADVISYHVGGQFEFPLLRDTLHGMGLKLLARGGYRTLPLTMRDIDIFAGDAPYYMGDQVKGDAASFGFSLETGAKIAFHVGFEFQSYKFRKWFLDDMRELDERELSFQDEWDRAPIIDRSVTVVRFSSEMHL